MGLFKRLGYLSVFFIIFIACGCRQPSRSLEGNEQGGSRKSVLKNGLIVVTRRIPRTPLVSIELLVKTGSAGERSYLGTGISHFLEHLIFKGAGDYRAGDIARHIKSLGGEINAFTNYDCTAFVITVPKENLEKAIEILVQAVYNPSFNADDFEKERQVILNEMRLNEDQPGRKILRLFWSNFYRRHPYRHPIIGYPELFSRLTLEDIADYHRKHYIPNNMILSVAGNFNDAAITELCEKKLSLLERGKEIEPIQIYEPPHISAYHHEEPFPTKLMYFVMGFSGIEIANPELFALDLLAIILGKGESSRLHNRLRGKENLVYSVSCFNHTPKDRGIFGISLIADYKNKDRILKEILEEIERVKRYGVSRRELAKARNILLSQFHFERERVEAQARELASGELLTGNPDFYAHYIEQGKRVTSRDLRDVARKYLKTDFTVSVLLRPQNESEIIQGKNRNVVYESEVEKIKLPNGITLLLKENRRLPLVSIQASFLAGLRKENRENNGVSNLCAELLTKGTRHKTAAQISRLVEGRGASLETFSGNNSLGIVLNLLSKDTAWGIRLLADIVRSPAFSEREAEKAKIQTIAEIKGIEDDSFVYAFKLLKKNLFLKHPYGMDILGEMSTVERISSKDIRDFYQSTILPPNCVISIVGDFERRIVIKEIKSSFSSWKTRGGFRLPQITEEPPVVSPRIIREKTEKKQAIVAIGFHAVSIYEPQRYAFEVLNAIMSGQGNRLFESIREQSGLAYAVGTYNLAGIEPGYFVYYAATDKDKSDKVKEKIFDEINNLRKTDFSDGEIERAKAYLIGEEKRQLQTNADFSMKISLDELYGLGFDSYKNFEERINSVTKEDLKAVGRQYFNLNNYVLVEITPQ